MEDDQPTESECWRGFWDIIGAEAYRLWREDQTPPAAHQDAA
ncbi:hypothetical protein [Streptomyces paludis]|nr:hypothetical protein [Streptomyces paludis]